MTTPGKRDPADLFRWVAENSGLNKTELASLYGVSRQMIHYWLNTSGPRENSFTARMQQVINAALVNSIEKKLLPLGAMTPEARAARIKKMATTLQDLKPAPRK